MTERHPEARRVQWSTQPDCVPSPGVRPGGGLVYNFLAAVDAEGFSKLDTVEQVRTQHDLGHVLDAAASRTGMDRTLWKRQVRGDGELAVLPADTDGPLLVAHFPEELATALKRLNSNRHPRPRLRLKLALHHGTLTVGSLGVVGPAPIVVSRLVDCDELRRALSHDRDFDLVLIVSASLYQDVVQSRFQGLEPADFSPVNVTAKGVSYLGYIRRIPSQQPAVPGLESSVVRPLRVSRGRTSA